MALEKNRLQKMCFSLCRVSWCSLQKLQNASIEKITEARPHRHLVRSFCKRARSRDLKYTFEEVHSTLTMRRHRQTQRMMPIVKNKTQNEFTKVVGIERHQWRPLRDSWKSRQGTDVGPNGTDIAQTASKTSSSPCFRRPIWNPNLLW